LPYMSQFPAPRCPKSGHWEFWQQNRVRSSMIRCAGSKESEKET
jgi:hypothetical protein